MKQEETIAAIATPVGEGGIGILRLSGKGAISLAARMFRPRRGGDLADLPSHRAVYGDIMEEGAPLDEAIAILMRAPHSYTREDVAEIQCHGGSVILRRALSLALSFGARLAELGEFTKRAFLNGRIDLAQAQGVMDVIAAKTDASLRLAAGHLSGRFSARIRAMRQKVLAIIAHLEVTIDFPEDDVDEVVAEDVRRDVTEILTAIEEMLSTESAGRILKDGLTTAIVGRPNVGKSSLLNALLREERAIVTDVPGTTRDSIEEYAAVGGVPLRLIDTAGIREASDDVEKIGIERAKSAVLKASLVLALFDSSTPLTAEDEAIFSLIGEKSHVFLLLTKADRPPCLSAEELLARAPGRSVFSLSVKTGDGLPALFDAVRQIVYGKGAIEEESAFLATAREAAALREAAAHLRAACQTMDEGLGEDFITIDLRGAWTALGKITGETVGEDILDEMFSKFCLGK
ncbi:MAG: tRNA uridine-5-carboxymethylaminomethyl(34) synthesis GTPase MnmE [Schwartzia sp. (in: firmicutes)]